MPSQYGQDRIVLQILNHKRGGFFLDSGANDGIRASNTRLLERDYGWRGICVDPNPEFFAQLVRNRDCHCVNACLYTHDGEVEFVEAGTLGGILEVLDPTVRERLDERTGGDLPIVRRPARTIESVLREGGAPAILDYWSLDTEGSELMLLQAFPFHAYTFRVLTVEHNWRVRTQEAIRETLRPHGFERLCTHIIDDIYVNTRLGLSAGSALQGRSLRRGVRRF